jgi:surface protein
MKTISELANKDNNYTNIDTIDEKLTVSKSKNKPVYKYFPETSKELKDLIKQLITERGWKADLNDIDTSKITDMSELFNYLDKFNGNISLWDVSNVTDMRSMFYGSRFNGDLSDWDVSKVTNMSAMFYGSRFNGDLSDWDVSNVRYMSSMFCRSDFDETQKDISNWNVSKVTDMSFMFKFTDYDGDLSDWDVSNVENMEGMFSNSDFTGNNGDISVWVLENIDNTANMFYDSQFVGNIKPWRKYMNGVSKGGMIEDCPIGERSHENYPKWIKR